MFFFFSVRVSRGHLFFFEKRGSFDNFDNKTPNGVRGNATLKCLAEINM